MDGEFAARTHDGVSARVSRVKKNCHPLLRTFARKLANCAESSDSLVLRFSEQFASEGGFLRFQS